MTAYTFSVEETDILVSALTGGIENRADDVDNEDHEADDIRDSALIERLNAALGASARTFGLGAGSPVELSAAERYDLSVLLDGTWDEEDPELALIERIRIEVWTVEVTRTETVIYEVRTPDPEHARENYIEGDIATSDGFEDVVVTPGEYDPSAPRQSDPPRPDVIERILAAHPNAESSQLDETVHDLVSRAASAINNTSVRAQVAFLLSQGESEEFISALLGGDVRGCSCGMADYGAPGHDGDPNGSGHPETP